MEWKEEVLPKTLLKKSSNHLSCFSTKWKTTIWRQTAFFVHLLHLNVTQRLEEGISTIINSFVEKMDGLSPNRFKGVYINDVANFEDLLTVNVLLYDLSFVHGNNIGELARRKVQYYGNTVRVLRYKIHICYVSIINAVFQSFPCCNWYTFLKKNIQFWATFNYMQWTSENWLTQECTSISRNSFDKLGSSGIKNTSKPKLIKKVAIFEFESLCVQEENFKDTKTRTCRGKHVPITVIISLNLWEKQFSIATLILITSLHPLLEFVKI